MFPIQKSRIFDLPANGFMNVSRIVHSIIGPDRDDLFGDLVEVTAELTVIEGEGALMIYTSSVDNGTGDSIIRIE